MSESAARAQRHTPPRVSSLIGISSDAKTVHGEEHGVLTGIMYLAPAWASGIVNLCKWASSGCIESCLNTAGRASFDSAINAARINRTIIYVHHKAAFWARLIRELLALIAKAERRGFVPCARLNGTSDQPWERIKIVGGEYDGLTIFEAFPRLQFYDYSKAPYRERASIPANYHLTYSRSETSTDSEISENIEHGRNVAVVFNCCTRGNQGRCYTKCLCPLPSMWNGYRVVSGDGSDLRFVDPVGVVVGLHAKGKARQDETGFVVQV